VFVAELPSAVFLFAVPSLRPGFLRTGGGRADEVNINVVNVNVERKWKIKTYPHQHQKYSPRSWNFEHSDIRG
jgi:hypothetical protein